MVPSEGGVARFVLDYGAGYGYDAEYYRWQPYDPNFNHIMDIPVWPEKWGFIVCIYVLCVCNRTEIEEIMADIFYRLRPGGVAYFAVRRDERDIGTKEWGKNKQTLQSDVYLNLPRVIKAPGYDIYEWRKDAGFTNYLSEEQAQTIVRDKINFVGLGTEVGEVQQEDGSGQEQD